MQTSKTRRLEYTNLYVKYSNNKFGKIIYETKNCFLIENSEKIKVVPKINNLFRIFYQKNDIIVDGSSILYRPEDRIKKCKINKKN